MEPSRRGFLTALTGAAAIALAGCGTDSGTDESSPVPSRGSPTRETGSETPPSAATPTRPSTAGPFGDQAARVVLPEPAGDWTRESASGLQVRYIGGVSGASAEYVGPEGVRFRVIVVERRDTSSAEWKAHGLYCDGWPVTVAHEEFAFATGSGTVQPTDPYTPETPPHMTRSPVPDTADRAAELLSHSPLLSERILDERGTDCDWNSGVRTRATDSEPGTTRVPMAAVHSRQSAPHRG